MQPLSMECTCGWNTNTGTRAFSGVPDTKPPPHEMRDKPGDAFAKTNESKFSSHLNFIPEKSAMCSWEERVE